MGFEFYKESYAGTIKEISIGKGSKSVVVGGETCYPFFQFEGKMPNKPKVAMEIWDVEPSDWPEAALSHFSDVVSSPASWAKKCVESYGAEIIVLQLKSTDPNGLNLGPESASKIVKDVLAVIDVPLIIWGIANPEKDEAVFKKIADDCQKYELVFGPVEDKNHKSIGAAAMGYGHLLISSSPIDVNLAKQVNILLENLGMQMNKILIDPTTGGLGYGLEYSYSVMERIRMAALTQGDDKLQLPIINNLGNEVWKSKEARQSVKEAPLLGDPERRGILMECVSAVAYLLAGSDILIMRHPEAIRLVKSYINLIMDGGNGENVSPIKKRLEKINIDFAKLSPTLNLTLDKEKRDKIKVKKNLKKSKVGLDEKVVSAWKEHKGELFSSSSEKDSKTVSPSKPEKKVDSKESDVIAKEKVVNLSEVKNEAKLEAIKKISEDRKIEVKHKDSVEGESNRSVKSEVEKNIIIKEAKIREKKEEEFRAKREKERLSTRKMKNSKVLSKIKKTPSAEQKDNSEKIIDRLMWVHKRIMLYKW